MEYNITIVDKADKLRKCGQKMRLARMIDELDVVGQVVKMDELTRDRYQAGQV